MVFLLKNKNSGSTIDILIIIRLTFFGEFLFVFSKKSTSYRRIQRQFLPIAGFVLL